MKRVQDDKIIVKKLINKLHKSKLLGAVFPTLDHCLRKELGDCRTVLDLGCGPSSPVQYLKNIKHSVGVEAFGPYLAQARKNRTHSEFMEKKIEEIDFPENSFDAVIMIEVIEHLPKDAGQEMIRKAEKWARKKVIITCPNGYLPQKELDGNGMQKHLSGWEFDEFKNSGYKSRGLAGLRCLRHEVEDETMGDDMMTTIRFRPKIFWFAIAALSQVFTYNFPRYAFELFNVKNMLKMNEEK